MRVTIGMIVLNEAEYLPLNLTQHYPLADRIVIVEGADRLYPNTKVSSSGLSTDETEKVVRGFPDPDKKITYVQHGWTKVGGDNAKSELRNRYMEHVLPGLLVVVDADEFYRREDFTTILHMVAGDNPAIMSWICPTVHFWRTQDRFITGGYYDVPHVRVWRIPPGANPRYEVNHNYLGFPTGEMVRQARKIHRNIVSAGVGGVDRHRVDGPCCYHYGFCKSLQEQQDKLAYYVNRGETVTRPKTVASREIWMGDDNSLPTGFRLWEYGGELPEVMQDRV